MGLFPNLPLAKFKSGVAPNQSLQQICLQPGEGGVPRPSKQSSQTRRISLGYLIFKVNEPVERRLGLQPPKYSYFKETLSKLCWLCCPCLLLPSQHPNKVCAGEALSQEDICCVHDCSSRPSPMGSGFFINVCWLCSMSGKFLDFLRLHSMPWKHCCVHACGCP